MPYSNIKGQYCSVKDGKLFFIKEGRGPLLIFLHGFGLDHRMWENQVDFFSKKYTCIAIDLRGFGNASVPGETSYSHHEDVNELLNCLGVEQPVTLIGLSMGARVVANFALVYPQRTKAVIFVDAAIDGYVFKDFDLAKIYTAGKEQGIEVANRMWLDHPIFEPAGKNEDVTQQLSEMVMSYSGWHWINKNPIVNLSPPAIEQIHKIAVPVLIVIGKLDIPDFKAIAALLNKQIPDSSKVEIAGAGHMSNMESPVIFNGHMNHFLDKYF